MPPDFKNLLPLLGTTIGAAMLPGILKGLLIDLFAKQSLDSKKLVEWVNNDISLWNMMDPKWQGTVWGLKDKLGDTKWFTPQWLIDAVGKDYPGVASLFMGWDPASKWLARQVNEIKKEIYSRTS